MTAEQCAERQAAQANQSRSIFRPETLERVQDVLKRMETAFDLSPGERGRLKWDAFCALTDMQTDLKLKFHYETVPQ